MHSIHKEFLFKLLSGPMILLMITWELRMALQNISRSVVSCIPINISPSVIFPTMLSPEIFNEISQAAFGRSEHLYWVNCMKPANPEKTTTLPFRSQY